MGTRLTGIRSGSRRGMALAAALVTAGGLTAVAIGASAAPAPTVAQVQAKVNQLTAQFNKVSEQLDQADEQLSGAQRQLKQVTARWQRANAQFELARTGVAQIAASAYEDAGSTSIAGVLSSDNPEVILQQGALLLQLSSTHDAQTQQLLSDASQLAGVQQEMQRTENGIASIKSQLTDRKSSLKKLISTEQATLASLTVPQQQQVANTTIGAGGSGNTTNTTTKQPYTGPTGTQAEAAVAFAYAQLGCAYVYGGTGPCPNGYDCSGLVQAAWAHAGLAIPRDTFEQWAALAHISSSAIEPGDLLYYAGESHVAMYVGGGMIIDAPIPGQVVEKIPMNSAWYAGNFDGAVRP
ncbi:MAG TPA: NlpC/P60 family protein [Streptosporangiaceae bacterium]